MTEEKCAEMPEKDRFENLVKYAEGFVEENAKILIENIRGEKYDNINKMITEKYHPQYSVNEIKKSEEIEKILIKRFCQELQNYQAMPSAINYISFSYKPDDKNIAIDGNSEVNDIYLKVLEFYEKNDKDIENAKERKIRLTKKELNGFQTYHIELYKFLHELYDQNKELEKNQLDKIEKVVGKENIEDYIKKTCRIAGKKQTVDGKAYEKGDKIPLFCYNDAWYRYSRGLMDVLIKLQDNEFQKYIKKLVSSISKEDIEDVPDDFHDDIFYLGKTLSRDFFKELCCANFIKDDIHIEELFKKYLDIKDKKDIFIKFKKLVEGMDSEKYTPYYIDKLLWLCCTGNFYEDGITINKMTRRNFFKFIDNKIDQEK